MKRLVAISCGLLLFGSVPVLAMPSSSRSPAPEATRRVHRFPVLRNARAVGLRMQRKIHRAISNEGNPSHHLVKAARSAGYLALTTLPLAALVVAKKLGAPADLINAEMLPASIIFGAGVGWNFTNGIMHLGEAVSTASARHLERKINNAVFAHQQGATNRRQLRKLLKKADKSPKYIDTTALRAELEK